MLIQGYLQFCRRYLSEFFWRLSWDVYILYPNNSEFFVCLSVCQLAYFLTDIRQMQRYLLFWMRYPSEIFWRHSWDFVICYLFICDKTCRPPYTIYIMYERLLNVLGRFKLYKIMNLEIIVQHPLSLWYSTFIVFCGSCKIHLKNFTPNRSQVFRKKLHLVFITNTFQGKIQQSGLPSFKEGIQFTNLQG